MPWKILLAQQPQIADMPLDDWYAELLQRAGPSSFPLAVLGGRLAATPGRAFLAGYQAALRALWPAAPLSLGAFCVTEQKGLRPAELQTRLQGLSLQGCKSFVTAAEAAAWYLVLARDEPAGDAPRLAVAVVLAGTPGAKLESLPPLSILPDIPHGRLLLTGAHCERLPGDGWEAYSKPFRSLEDLYVLSAICAWLYERAVALHWPESLLLGLIAVLSGCGEVSRQAADRAETHLLLAGLFGQFTALAEPLTAAMASTDPNLAALWQTGSALLSIASGARAKRLEKAYAALGLDPNQ